MIVLALCMPPTDSKSSEPDVGVLAGVTACVVILRKTLPFHNAFPYGSGTGIGEQSDKILSG